LLEDVGSGFGGILESSGSDMEKEARVITGTIHPRMSIDSDKG